MQTTWEQRYSQRALHMKSSIIRELLKLTDQPDIISFAGGLPAPEVFPVAAFEAAFKRVIPGQATAALQYGTTEGFTPLRQLIAELTSKGGAHIKTENVTITSGSQQALDLLGKVFINPGDRILVEDPTYLGAMQAWGQYGAEYVTVPSDEDGIQIDALEKVLRTGPKFMYIISNFQNPTGVTLTLERRKRVVELADRFGVPIIEDDPYGQLRFEGESVPSLLALDEAIHPLTADGANNGNVIYLSTFSKTLAPGLRLAWAVGPSAVLQKLVMAKQGTDLNTSTLNQILAYEVARDGFLEEYKHTIISLYRERRNVMLDALEEHMPQGVHWTHPQGGLFLWATLPEPLNSLDLFQKAIQEKVAYVPGMSFYSKGGGERTMRLNFSYSPPDRINEGIYRLAQVFRKAMG